MKLFLLSLAVLLSCCSIAVAQQPFQVQFLMKSPALADTTTVYITGSIPQLGNWDPATARMEYIGNHTWSKTIELQEPQTVEYKYTLGSWDREGTDADAKALQNFRFNATQKAIITNEVLYWLDKKTVTLKGGVTGTTELHKNLTGKGIKDRDLIVWLPPGYATSTKKYPVLYMHDGQNVFDPATSSFGVDWQIDETADSLIKAGAIAPVIIVGIYNTPDRSDEYTPGEKGNAYMDFVVNTVKPYIDQAYRTKKGRKHTFTGGSSAGGIMAFMLAWEYPKVFSKAICMSPAFKIQHIDYVKDVRNYQGRKKKLFFYIDNGGIELEERLQPGIDEMIAALKEKGYKAGKDFIWIKDPEAKHFEAAWAKRMPLALKTLLPPKE
ncbi:alpha/beta hydrolase-fold protein [Pontibacter sp. MBLB2868]|uniref:alpha/beta hydrolase-fold protein n=1 Tax=Pontibacter sp. MBLB2868 TaxID=3451555 RepID=UPI003F74DA0B